MDLNKPPTTRKAVIKALESLGVEPGWELVQGEGYLYFVGPDDCLPVQETSVYVPRLRDLTLEQWVSEFQRITGRKDDLKPLPKPPEPSNVWITSAGRTTITLK